MKSVTTRELVHGIRNIRRTVESGETVEWVFRGKKVAMIQPMRDPPRPSTKDWVARATAAGAIHRGKQTVAALVYDDR